MWMSLTVKKYTHGVISGLVNIVLEADLKAVLNFAQRYRTVNELSLYVFSMYLVKCLIVLTDRAILTSGASSGGGSGSCG